MIICERINETASRQPPSLLEARCRQIEIHRNCFDAATENTMIILIEQRQIIPSDEIVESYTALLPKCISTLPILALTI